VVKLARVCACIALLFAALAPSLASARVRVEVDRDPVVADESFDVTFTSDTRDAGDPDFAPLERDFDILARSSQTSLQIINGRPESGQSWVLSLIAKRSGRIQLPSITFGKEHSEPLVLDVRPSAGGGADSDVFLTVEASPQPAYVQAQILVTVRLYVGVQVGNATLSDLQATGAVIEKLGDDRRRDEMRGGRNYTVFERRYAVFAERSGTLTIAPVEFAGALLGRVYSIEGIVVTGRRRGRELGFPTANLETSNELIPPHGVYATMVTIDGTFHGGVTNIGTRPTFGDSGTTVETHVLADVGDLYGKTMQVAFIQRLRDERRFEDVDALRTQIEADRRRAQGLLSRLSV